MHTCQCGCGVSVKGEGWFASGHDQILLAAIAWRLGSVANMADLFGYGPGGRNAVAELAARHKKAS